MSDFTCMKCGGCCRVPGYVRLHAGEVETIARHLDMAVDTFVGRYTRVTADRRHLSLNESTEHHCVFLTLDRECRIQPVKPRQCREFPVKWRFEGWEDVCAAAG